MKTDRYILTLAIWLLGFTLYSQNAINLNSEKPLKTANIELVSSDIETSVMKFSFDGFTMKPVQTPNGTKNIITVGSGTPMLIKGAPDMQKLTASLIIPDKGAMKAEVVSSNYTEYANVDIAPSKGNLTRDIDPATIPFTYGQAYSEDVFYPGKLVEIRDPYILRDYRGEAVWIYPFQYNPVTKVLRVYSEITVKVSKNGTSGTNELIRTKSLTKVDDEFLKIYRYHFLNYKGSKYAPLEEQGNMLVICYDAFMSAMRPFVDWKNTIGRYTEMVGVSTVGTNPSDIKTYVENYYNTNGLTYLLLVGDAAQVPPYNAVAGPSDNSYGYILGGDSYPEVFVGRFSAENVSEVQTQVQRTISYELNPSTASNWLNKGVGIASDLGSGDDNEYDYEHIRNLRTKLINYQYSAIDELYDGSQGGQDLSGDPDPSMLATDVNAGAGIICYTGHGASDQFVTTGFSSSDVNNLTNNNMWPFIWSVACVNGEFTSGTCFAEAWLRATHNGQPSGTIATLMSTINQSWDPPMEGEDEMVDILVESYTGNIKRTFGGLSMNGCMKMNDAYGPDGTEMTDTWTIFGDPSLMVRTDTPKVITVTHPSVINIGAIQMTVNCDVEGALVALTINKQIIGTGVVSGGSVTINFSALTAVDTIKVAATAYNYIPYLGNAQIIVPSGPWVMYFSNIIDDASGNNNGLPDNNELISLDVTLKNVGVATANGVSASCSTTDPYITMTDTTQAWGDIAIGASSIQDGAFSFQVADSIPDQHIVLFTIRIKDNDTNIWVNNFNIIVNAPVLSIGNITIDDVAGGNGNGNLDPGETANIVISVTNTGHANAFNTQSVLTSGSSSYVTLNSDTSTLDTINVGSATNATFNISINAATPVGTIVDFTDNVTYFDYSVQRVFYKKVGLVDENWETGAFTKFQWVQGGNAPWIISNVSPYEGIYCAKSGTITDSRTSELMITFNVLANDSISFYKKVSSEDYYDYLKFYIDASEQGEWCGEVPWSRNIYPVTTGNHTFKWVYEKDYMMSAGSDCAWIDYIIFPPVYVVTSADEFFVNGVLFNFYPNPSDDKGIINYSLAEDSNVSLAVYNSTGQQVINLVNKYQIKGLYSAMADLSGLRAGVYYCRLIVSGGSITRKIILTR